MCSTGSQPRQGCWELRVLRLPRLWNELDSGHQGLGATHSWTTSWELGGRTAE